MPRPKLTAPVVRRALGAARRLIVAPAAGLTRRIAACLGLLPAQAWPTHDPTPVLHRLTGILPADASLDEYHAYLERKYGS
jgi:hypothetical protein